MVLAKCPVIRLRAAVMHCARNRISPFSMRRLKTPFEWLPERHRFAFASGD